MGQKDLIVHYVSEKLTSIWSESLITYIISFHLHATYEVNTEILFSLFYK